MLPIFSPSTGPTRTPTRRYRTPLSLSWCFLTQKVPGAPSSPPRPRPLLRRGSELVPSVLPTDLYWVSLFAGTESSWIARDQDPERKTPSCRLELPSLPSRSRIGPAVPLPGLLAPRPWWQGLFLLCLRLLSPRYCVPHHVLRSCCVTPCPPRSQTLLSAPLCERFARLSHTCQISLLA